MGFLSATAALADHAERVPQLCPQLLDDAVKIRLLLGEDADDKARCTVQMG